MDDVESKKVLRGKYTLIKKIVQLNQQPFETWYAIDEDRGAEYLVKIWPFVAGEATDLQRALWDSELRNMYRVSSTPGAESSLLIIRDAGLDNKNNCFVMVLTAVGSSYENLADVIKSGEHFSWLWSDNIQAKAKLWKGLRQIANGIQVLHSQAMIHRNVCLENIYFHPDSDPSSFRLGGFEWSLRVGEMHLNTPPSSWATPPELFKSPNIGYEPEMDWYGFGILAARCIINLESFASLNIDQRHARIIQTIENASTEFISDLEKTILLRLIDRKVTNRLIRASDIIKAIDELVLAFQGAEPVYTQNPLLLLYNPDLNELQDAVKEAGFKPVPEDEEVIFNPDYESHIANLDLFIQNDLSEALLYHVSDKSYILIGKQLSFKITRYRRTDQKTRSVDYTWDAAYVLDMWGLRYSDGGSEIRDLPKNSILVRTPREIRQESTLLSRAHSWKDFLPYEDRSSELRSNLATLLDFIRCTNQIELLMRDAEMFQFEKVDYHCENQSETFVIREAPRERPVFEPVKLEDGLTEFIQRVIELNIGSIESSRVVITSDDESSLRLEYIDPIKSFYVKSIDSDKKIITLGRTAVANVTVPPPDHGWIRSYGMFGEFELLRRRTDAIKRLESHSYLLRSLYTPGLVRISTGVENLPAAVQEEKVDIAKQAVMKDVFMTRPIYTLQGPPGTGKTTMVAHLLRQIFTDDPVTQVLITAQAHGAVDVLRSKVQNEAFADIDPEKQPLAVRLARPSQKPGEHEVGSVEDVAIHNLDYAIRTIEGVEEISALQNEWLEYAKNIRDAIRTDSTQYLSKEFCEMVKRGANIVYSTTSAGDLEELALSKQSYDWAIIEEAGKCHAFDLALPLQAGHRWLLIGDQKQLPAYRIKDFEVSIDELDNAVEALLTLPDSAGKLLDMDWISKWRSYDDSQKEAFIRFCKDWIRTFKYLFERCKNQNKGLLTLEKPLGAAAGMLSMQYRMHPTIGSLISKVYYDDQIKNMTEDETGAPQDRVVAPFVTPWFSNKDKKIGIIWLDTPSARQSELAREQGPRENLPRYSNPYEAGVIREFLQQFFLEDEYLQKTVDDPNQFSPLKLAVLSPYNQQVGVLRKTLRAYKFPKGIEPKRALQTRKTSQASDNIQFVHTVDSFQGNEADVVVVSLVRNNTIQEARSSFGFLVERERTNVLLSRAQRLLILVGSWEFFVKQTAKIPDDPSREEYELKRAIEIIGGWFLDGQAIKIEATHIF